MERRFGSRGDQEAPEDPYEELADAALQAVIDRQRRVDAAGERRREYWLTRQAAEEGTLGGILVDLGERGDPVALSTAARRTVHGRVTTVGTDFVGLVGRSGEVVLVPLDAVTTVRIDPGRRPTLGDRSVAAEGLLAVRLQVLTAERPRVVLHTWSGEAINGDLVGAGRDLVVIRGTASTRSYVPVDAINDVTVT